MNTTTAIDWLKLANHFRRQSSVYWRWSMAATDGPTRRLYRGYSDRFETASTYCDRRHMQRGEAEP